MGTRTGASSMGQFQAKHGDVRAEVHHSVPGNQSRESRQPNIPEQPEKQQSSSQAHSSSGPASVSKSTKKLHQSQMSTDSSNGQGKERRERSDTSRNSCWALFSLSDQIDQVQHSLVGNKFRESRQPNNQEQSEKQPNPSWDHSNLAKASVSKLPKTVQRCRTLSSDSCYGGETLDKLIQKRVIPKIVVTQPLEEEMSGTPVDDLPEPKTIRDTEDYGSYSVHSKPSTIEAYQVKKETP